MVRAEKSSEVCAERGGGGEVVNVIIDKGREERKKGRSLH